MSITVLCAADLHLGVRSSGVFPDGFDSSATTAWGRIVDEALRRQVDLVAVAGDVFDGDGTYLETADGFARGLARLRAAGVPVVAVAGNHDFSALRRFARTWPAAGLVLLGVAEAASQWTEKMVETRHGPVRVLGWSFSRAEERCHPQAVFSARPTSLPTLGLLHGDDAAANTRYAPLDRAGLRALPVDAWVLGHIHKPETPAPGEKPCFYPGSPQAMDFGPGEMGSHGVVVLTLGGGEPPEFVPISNVVYAETDFDLDAHDGSDEAETSVLRQLQEFLTKVRTAHAMPGPVSVQVRARLGGESTVPAAGLRARFPAEPLARDDDAVAYPVIEPLPPMDLAAAAAVPDALGFAAGLLRGLQSAPPDSWAAAVTQRALDTARQAWATMGLEEAARHAEVEAGAVFDDDTVRRQLVPQCRRLIAALRAQQRVEAAAP